MEPTTDDPKMEMSPDILKNLNATRKWTMFLAVLGFIFLGFLIIFGLVTSSFLSFFKSEEVNLGIPESLIIVLFLVIATIYFFPVFSLFRFSRNMRDAVQTSDLNKLKKAFKHLRFYFTYTGILVIIVLTIYVVALIVAGASISLLTGL